MKDKLRKLLLRWVAILEKKPEAPLAEDETDISPQDFAKTKAALALVKPEEVVISPQWDHKSPTLGGVLMEGREQALQDEFANAYDKAVADAVKEDEV